MVERLVLRPASPGEMLKPEFAPEHKRKDTRERDEDHLANIRLCRCLACGIKPAGEAAHIRMTRAGKAIVGMGRRPDDRYALPLCHACHMEQHDKGERMFFSNLGFDPNKEADRFYNARMSLRIMQSIADLIHERVASEL